MDKIIISLRFLFYFSLVLLVIISFFPGSFMGLLVFGDIGRQPSLVDNPIQQIMPGRYYAIGNLINHFIFFLYISLLGFVIYFKDKNFQKLVFILLFLSVFLELAQFFVPRRAFEINDIFANLLGVSLAYSIIKIYKFCKK